jgi:hypothetical protein
MEEANKNTLQNHKMEEISQNQINNFILWGLFFTSQSAVGRLRTLELAAIGVSPEQSGALILLAGNNGK